MESIGATQVLLQYLRISYPILLLVVFSVVFVTHSAAVARDADEFSDTESGGPGGKPLPKRIRLIKMVSLELPAELQKKRSRTEFMWMTICILLLYLAEAALNMVHAMIARSERWWCGQAVVVSSLAESQLDQSNRFGQIFVVGSFFVHTIILISLLDMDPSPNVAQCAAWSLALPMELAILAISISI